MAIIRPLAGPGNGPGAEGRGDEQGTDPRGHTVADTFQVPESVWDVDAVVLVEHTRVPEQRAHDTVDAATRWNHPSTWQGAPSMPPLTVVRPEEPAVRAAEVEEQWLQGIVQAATMARRADNPDAWRGVAAAADLVSEMARALELVAQASQEAAECHRAARHAARLAREADETAQNAARQADAATRRAQELESAVDVARRINSAESWGQVRRLAMTRQGADDHGAPSPPDIG